MEYTREVTGKGAQSDMLQADNLNDISTRIRIRVPIIGTLSDATPRAETQTV